MKDYQKLLQFCEDRIALEEGVECAYRVHYPGQLLH